MDPQEQPALKRSRIGKAAKARRREKYRIKKANKRNQTANKMDMDGDMAEAGENEVEVEDVAEKTAHKRNRIGKGAKERRKLKYKEKRKLKRKMLHEKSNIGDEDDAVGGEGEDMDMGEEGKDMDRAEEDNEIDIGKGDVAGEDSEDGEEQEDAAKDNSRQALPVLPGSGMIEVDI